MVKRPAGMSAFEFSVLSSLRVVQLARGCTPRVTSDSKITIQAQLEVAAGCVSRSAAPVRI